MSKLTKSEADAIRRSIKRWPIGRKGSYYFHEYDVEPEPGEDDSGLWELDHGRPGYG